MDKVKVIYGSTTGNTENAARRIADAFGVEPIPAARAAAADFNAELLILGSSTWGMGELQDDWMEAVSLLENADLSGKKVAVFGTGDQNGFADTYCDALEILADKAEAAGATLVGETSAADYIVSREGGFCGLALDDDNEPEKTDGRIAGWIEKLKS